MKREKQTSYNRPAPVEGLPESPELERAVLGALILEPGQLPDLMAVSYTHLDVYKRQVVCRTGIGRV